MALLVGAAVAADVSGKWRAEFTTPDGTARFNNFTFKQDGEKLTGTVAGAQDETPIANGTVKGDEISFTADRPFGKFTYKGKVSGDEIKFTVSLFRSSPAPLIDRRNRPGVAGWRTERPSLT
jgi:hypothetical protein